MPKDFDDEVNKETFSLDDILAEFGGDGKVIPFPAASVAGQDDAAPMQQPAPKPAPKRGPKPAEKPDGKAAAESEAVDEPTQRFAAVKLPKGAVLDFPSEEVTPLQAGFQHLQEKADAYAETMFEDEGVEVSDETVRIEKLIPGVDEERPMARPSRERAPRKAAPPPPDLPPLTLAKRYSHGLSFMRLRMVLVFFLLLPALYLNVAELLPWGLPALLTSAPQVLSWVCGGLVALAALLGLDVIGRGLLSLVLLRPSGETVITLAVLATVADAFTQTLFMPLRPTQPFAAAAILLLFSALYGTHAKRQGQRLACRTAGATAQPFLITLDEQAWDGRSAYAKWSGSMAGFGSQMQLPDGAQRIYRLAAPLLLLGALVCATIASVGTQNPAHFLWCFSAALTASASLSSMIAFARPFRALTRRIAASGAALAGWSGAEKAGRAILLTDTDLFPTGMVTLNGIKIFGDFPVDKVVGAAATLIRESGGGLDKLFHDLLRAQGAVYYRTEGVARHEGGGISGSMRGQQVLVGSASFMALMDVLLPQGLNVRNAVFCALDGELAGIFALNYALHGTVPQALSSLIHAKIAPVLATRDFNLIPAMLRQKFKLPAERMDFPPIERRVELSNPASVHNECLTAVLCTEGVGPFSEVVMGARRLRGATLLASTLSVVGAIVGLLLAFYLTFISAYDSLSPASLVVFLVAWYVPTLLITNWVNQY